MARTRLPLALARAHAELPVGASLRVESSRSKDSDVERMLTGAGFVDARWADPQLVTATRARTLPDVVGPRMRVLVCGLNPSLYAADAGVGFARPGNRFWPAALTAGLVSADRDPWAALAHHGVGFTDLVKRATVRASELAPAEYHSGVERVAWLVGWLRPAAVCFVGLDGWRKAVDRHARPGPQPGGFAGSRAYVMPSTSGLNANASFTELVSHLKGAALLAGRR